MLPRLVLPTLVLAVPLAAAPMDDALALFQARKYPEARAAFEAITVAEPTNAKACSCVAEAIVRSGGGVKALDEALPWMEKAATLAPKDPHILSSYGQLCMQFAGAHTSISAARKGKDAIDAALALKPDDLDARETLYFYYAQAPWPIGSSAKAAAQLQEITQRDPRRGGLIAINARLRDKDYAGAFKLCDELLAKQPDDYPVLFNYSRVAANSGQNLARGVACLQKCLALGPTAPGARRPADIWARLGYLHEKLGDAAAARSDYEAALKLEPQHKAAAAALAAMK
jgi:tetratricopeptide (TPR) repeat protein